MPDYSAGTASVRIRPNADDFVRDLNAKLKAVKDPGYPISVSANTGQASADIKRFRDVESRNGMKLGVDVALGQAQADMAAFRARQRADGLTIKVDADTKSADNQLSALQRRLSTLASGRDALRLNIGAGLLGSVQPAVAGLASVAAGLQQVSGAALAVPGAIAGAAASIGTLAFGLSGISDAYKAVSDASESAGKDQAASARQAAQASNTLRNAVVDEAQARKDVAEATRDARNELRDLHTEMRGGLINESRAILQAQQARERFAKGDYTDQRDALLDIAEADQRVLEVRQRNADKAVDLAQAQREGVAGSDQVVAANERLVRSQQQVADAQMGAAEAATSMGAAQEKAMQEMAKLSPSAQKFVQTLVDMKPQFAEFRAAAAEPLLEGKDVEFRNFYEKVAPSFKTGMGEIAGAWNDNITALTESLGSDTGVGFIDRILGNTGDAQSRLTKAVDPVVRVIGTLSAAGSDVLPRLADATGRFADRLADALTEADKDGSLDAMINRGLDGLTSLGRTTVSFGKSLNAITSSAGGGSFLQWLETSTDRMQKFLNSAEGKNKIREYLADGRDLAQKIGEALSKLPGALAGVQDAAQTYLGGALVIVRELAALMGEHPDLVKTVVAAYLTWKTVTPIVQGVGGLLTGMSTSLVALGTGFSDTRKKASDEFGVIQKRFDDAGGPKGLGKFSGALAALGAAAGPFGLLAGTIASVAIPALMNLKTAHEEAAEKVGDLNQRELELEQTLDRVTGKMTAQSRDSLLQQAQDFAPKGPGAGIPGISEGNALAAATSLGINPKTYGDALTGNGAAQQQVRDILSKNNLVPEFQANAQLTGDANFLSNITGGSITQDKLISALLGDTKAIEEFTAALEKAELGATEEQSQRLAGLDLASISQRLSDTGRASVLAGGALNYLTSPIAPAQQSVVERNQANYGRFRLTDAGRGFFGGDLQVTSSGSDYSIVAPAMTPGLQASLQASQLEHKVNSDGSVTIVVPPNSSYIESYAKGGPTPSGRGNGPTGGHISELHGDEWVLPKEARAAIGDKTLAALTAGRSFSTGGEMVDEFGNPVTPGMLPGPVSAPATMSIAPNPTAGGGGVSGILSQVVSGMQGPIGNAMALGQQLGNIAAPGAAGGGGVDPNTTTHGTGASLLPGLSVPAVGGGGGDFASRMAGVPGLAGLFGSMASPDPKGALMNWGSQTANWVANWGVNTLGSVASTLWQGGLGFFGLENSILSPSNPYHQAAAQTGQFFMAQDGPLGQLLGMGGGGAATGGIADPKALGAAHGVDDGTLAALFGQTGDPAALQAMTPAAQRAIMYAQQHAVGQKYEYGGTGATGGYDCSGIASQLYASYMGLPPGRYFDTEADFEAMGFKQGYKPGALNIGVQRGGGGPNSHMAVTLPNGIPVESGGSHGSTAYGGPARGANTFPLQWYLEPPPGFEKGGPTPDYMGPVDNKGGHLAVVHPREFMISARGRASVPDGFLHKLNQGIVDPTELGLRGYWDGGSVMKAAMARPTPPRPPVVPARTMQPRPQQPRTAPAAPAPSATPAPSSSPAPSAPPSPAAPPQQSIAAQGGAPAPSIIAANQGAGGINHNVDWMNTLIRSSASNLGQLASTAMSIASMGGAGIPGMGAIGAAGPFVAGGIQQGGKVVEGIVNVVSSALVGSVPGSFGGKAGESPYGRVIKTPTEAQPPSGQGRGGNTYNLNGISDIDRLMDRIELNDKMSEQATLAKAYP
jgi:hypothetical protein